MNFDEAMDPETVVSMAEAQAEIGRHGLSFAAFAEVYGTRAEYRARDVLIWLGY